MFEHGGPGASSILVQIRVVWTSAVNDLVTKARRIGYSAAGHTSPDDVDVSGVITIDARRLSQHNRSSNEY